MSSDPYHNNIQMQQLQLMEQQILNAMLRQQGQPGLGFMGNPGFPYYQLPPQNFLQQMITGSSQSGAAMNVVTGPMGYYNNVGQSPFVQFRQRNMMLGGIGAYLQSDNLSTLINSAMVRSGAPGQLEQIKEQLRANPVTTTLAGMAIDMAMQSMGINPESLYGSRGSGALLNTLGNYMGALAEPVYAGSAPVSQKDMRNAYGAIMYDSMMNQGGLEDWGLNSSDTAQVMSGLYRQGLLGGVVTTDLDDTKWVGATKKIKDEKTGLYEFVLDDNSKEAQEKRAAAVRQGMNTGVRFYDPSDATSVKNYSDYKEQDRFQSRLDELSQLRTLQGQARTAGNADEAKKLQDRIDALVRKTQEDFKGNGDLLKIADKMDKGSDKELIEALKDVRQKTADQLAAYADAAHDPKFEALVRATNAVGGMQQNASGLAAAMKTLTKNITNKNMTAEQKFELMKAFAGGDLRGSDAEEIQKRIQGTYGAAASLGYGDKEVAEALGMGQKVGQMYALNPRLNAVLTEQALKMEAAQMANPNGVGGWGAMTELDKKSWNATAAAKAITSQEGRGWLVANYFRESRGLDKNSDLAKWMKAMESGAGSFTNNAGLTQSVNISLDQISGMAALAGISNDEFFNLANNSQFTQQQAEKYGDKMATIATSQASDLMERAIEGIGEQSGVTMQMLDKDVRGKINDSEFINEKLRGIKDDKQRAYWTMKLKENSANRMAFLLATSDDAATRALVNNDEAVVQLTSRLEQSAMTWAGESFASIAEKSDQSTERQRSRSVQEAEANAMLQEKLSGGSLGKDMVARFVDALNDPKKSVSSVIKETIGISAVNANWKEVGDFEKARSNKVNILTALDQYRKAKDSGNEAAAKKAETAYNAAVKAAGLTGNYLNLDKVSDNDWLSEELQKDLNKAYEDSVTELNKKIESVSSIANASLDLDVSRESGIDAGDYKTMREEAEGMDTESRKGKHYEYNAATNEWLEYEGTQDGSAPGRATGNKRKGTKKEALQHALREKNQAYLDKRKELIESGKATEQNVDEMIRNDATLKPIYEEQQKAKTDLDTHLADVAKNEKRLTAAEKSMDLSPEMRDKLLEETKPGAKREGQRIAKKGNRYVWVNEEGEEVDENGNTGEGKGDVFNSKTGSKIFNKGGKQAAVLMGRKKTFDKASGKHVWGEWEKIKPGEEGDYTETAIGEENIDDKGEATLKVGGKEKKKLKDSDTWVNVDESGNILDERGRKLTTQKGKLLNIKDAKQKEVEQALADLAATDKAVGGAAGTGEGGEVVMSNVTLNFKDVTITANEARGVQGNTA